MTLTPCNGFRSYLTNSTSSAYICSGTDQNSDNRQKSATRRKSQWSIECGIIFMNIRVRFSSQQSLNGVSVAAPHGMHESAVTT